jgi:hypothetical protein
MKTALLCNGPSRELYQSDESYKYIIGCNIPWTRVNSTVVMDVGVLEKFDSTCFIIVSRKAWLECPMKFRNKLIGQIIGMFDPYPEYDSAGHAACRKLLELGSTEINIYGCDSWFTNNTESYTHQYVDGRSVDMSKNVSVWRARWYELMAKNSQVKFNFIGDPK